MAAGKKKQYSDPKVYIKGLSPEELESVKWILLETLSGKFDRVKACKVAGISLRELKLLLEADEQFRERYQAIKNADDDELADLGRLELKRLLKSSEQDSVKLRVAMYFDKSRGNYSETQKVEHSQDQDKPLSSPVNLDQFRPPTELKAVNGD